MKKWLKILLGTLAAAAGAPSRLLELIASGEVFDLPCAPLCADTAQKGILRLPSKIFFP